MHSAASGDLVLKSLTGLKRRDLARRKCHFFGHARLDARAGAALSEPKGAETGALHLITLFQVALAALEHPLSDRLDVLLTQAGLLGELLDHIHFSEVSQVVLNVAAFRQTTNEVES